MSEKIKLPYISPEIITEIKISGAFYQNIMNSYYYFVSLYSKEDITEILTAIKENSYENLKQELIPASNSIMCLIILLREIEEKFKDQTILKEIDITDKEKLADMLNTNTFDVSQFPTVNED